MIDWDFIIGVGIVATIWLATMLAVSPRINKYVSKEREIIVKKITQHKKHVSKRLFETWQKEYEDINKVNEYLNIAFKTGLILILFLIIGSFHIYIPENYKGFSLMINAIIIWCTILFSISFVTLLWWYRKNITE